MERKKQISITTILHYSNISGVSQALVLLKSFKRLNCYEKIKMGNKKDDLAGPGIGNYDSLEKILPQDYSSLLTPRETQEALFAGKTILKKSL